MNARVWCAVVCVLTAAPGSASGQRGAADGEWRYWGGDAGSTRYAPLEQISRATADSLRVVWRWKSANFGPEPETYYRATPLFARGRLFTVAGERRAVAAIHPGSGETLWTWRMDEGPRWEFAPRRFSGRGLAYWTDGRDERVIVVTPGFHLVALDARTGKPAAGFGELGVVDLHRGLGYELVALDSVEDRRATNPGPSHPWWGIDPLEGKVGSSSPPIVVGDVIVVGSSAIQGYYPRRLKNVPGAIRGFDVRTGKQLWVFNVIPKAGELGHDSWLNESWKVAGKVDAWAPYSADTELGIVYLPVGHAHNDHFGGHRPGANLFSQSVLALDAKTGRRVWHYQLVHHDLWNSDTPTAPNVVDVAVGGRPVKMVVQTTKQAWAYVFDRTNGRPVWPIEERPVGRSDVPGEWTSPTQPFPTRPRAYESQGVSADDLIDFTPALRQEALTLIKDYRIGPIFTPPSILTASDGTKGLLQKPGANGGTNIQGGAAVDPETGILYVASIAGHSRIALEHNPARSEMDYVSMGPSGLRGPQGLPLFKPPYGRITAIDLKTGEHRWWIPNGDTPRAVKTHEALRGLTIAPTGKNSHANILVTKTLLFYGEGTNGDPLFHIADKATGQDIRSVRLPASTNAAPMTFMYNGRQYIVVAVADADVPGELVALALSAEPRSSGNQSDR